MMILFFELVNDSETPRVTLLYLLLWTTS